MVDKVLWFKEKMGVGPKAKAARQAKQDAKTQEKLDQRWQNSSAALGAMLDKVNSAITLFEEVVPAVSGPNPSESQQARAAHNGWRQQQTAIAAKAQQDPAGASADADALVTTLTTEYTRIRKSAKKKPYPVTVTVNGAPQSVKVYGADIPGFYEAADDQARQKLINDVAPKIGRGMDKLRAIKAGQGGTAEPKDVTDLLWAIKSIGQQKEGAAWDKGAMAVEDTGEALRTYLDTCSSELYLRSSSHFREQQKLDGQQSRGMDFYGGTDGGHDIANADMLLPTGMNTLTYQTMTLPDGKKTLYLKMETEGAFKTSPEHRRGVENLQTRPQREGDRGNTRRHAMNFIGKHKSDDELSTFREEVPDDIKNMMKGLIKSLDQKPSKPLQNALKASMGVKPNKVGKEVPTFRINTFVNALNSIPPATVLTDKQKQEILAFQTTINARYPDAPMRGGGELVIAASDLP